MSTINVLAVDATTGLLKEISISLDSTVATIPATEALAAGAIINIYSASGTTSVRNANASDNTKPAHGFVTAAVASGASATVYFPGQLITGLSGLTLDVPYFLSTTAGGITTTPPSGTGTLLQVVGYASDTTSLLFQPSTMPITRA